MNDDNEIKLGDEAEDRITGFKGTVLGICKYLTGHTTYCLQPHGLHEGKIIDAEWINSKRVEKLGPK